MINTNVITIYETGPNPPALQDWTFSAGDAPYGYGLKLWMHDPAWTLCLGYRCCQVPAAALLITAPIFALVLVVAVRRVICHRL